MKNPEEIPINSQKDKNGKKEFFKELIKFTFIALLIVVPFRYFIAQPFIVNGASMNPTFLPGEYLIVDQLSYRAFEEPERGSIIIFRYPKDPSKFFIKRIIGLPGETIEINDQEIKIRNYVHPQGIVLNEDYIVYNKRDSIKVELEEDEYFVMGDNRASSSDSRIWGPLKRDLIIGRPLLRLFPINRLGIFPGEHKQL